jgi:hypothetical protein
MMTCVLEAAMSLSDAGVVLFVLLLSVGGLVLAALLSPIVLIVHLAWGRNSAKPT